MTRREGVRNLVIKSTEKFEVTWENPDDAKLSWMMDKMHFPRPIAPFTVHLLEPIESSIFGARTVLVNGYRYAANSMPPMPPPEVMERGAVAVWQEDYLPKIKEFCDSVRRTDFDAMPAPALLDAIEALIPQAVDAFRYTMLVAIGFGMPTMVLLDFLEEEFGEDGLLLGGTLIQAVKNETADAGAALARMAKLAEGHPQVAAAIRAGQYADIESKAGGAEFNKELAEVLDEYGWRLDSWADLHVPTWAEDPQAALALIRHYLEAPDKAPDAAIERAEAQRNEALRRVESTLDGEKLEKFRQLLAAAGSHVPMSEGRAFYQLTIAGVMRIPVLALGRKLVAAGIIEEANDAFFLDLNDLRDAVAGRAGDRKSLVNQRKTAFAEWQKLDPPPFIGAPPVHQDMPRPMELMMTRFFGLRAPEAEGRTLKGIAASQGTVRARARLIMDLQQADRLAAGEVLVCPSTAPPWTPLFAIAAAVVTDTGGVLSHSAICAREYAIPCVVGTQIGTQMIPDGAFVVVDGSKGTVTIEG